MLSGRGFDSTSRSQLIPADTSHKTPSGPLVRLRSAAPSPTSPALRPPLAGAAPGTDGREIQRRTNDLKTRHLTRLLLGIRKRSGQEWGDTRVIIVSSHLHERVSDARIFGGAGRHHSGEPHGVSKVALVHHSFEIQRRFADGSRRVRRAWGSPRPSRWSNAPGSSPGRARPGRAGSSSRGGSSSLSPPARGAAATTTRTGVLAGRVSVFFRGYICRGFTEVGDGVKSSGEARHRNADP